MANDYISQWDLNGDVYDIHDSDRGLPNGVATLDENSIVPDEQLPSGLVRSVNNILPEDGNVSIPDTPMSSSDPSWSMLAMFSGSYGKTWSGGGRINAIYKNGVVYALDATFRRIQKSTHPNVVLGYEGELFASLPLDNGFAYSSGFPVMFATNTHLFVFCNTSDGACHILKYNLTDGSLVFHASQADSAFTQVKAFSVSLGRVVVSYNISSNATVTGYIGLVSELTSDSILLEHSYTNGIESIINLTGNVLLFSITGTGVLRYYLLTNSRTYTDVVTDSSSYVVQDLLYLDYNAFAFISRTASKVYRAGCSISSSSIPSVTLTSVTELSTDVAYALASDNEFMYEFCAGTTAYRINLEYPSIKEAITLHLPSNVGTFSPSECRIASGVWILTGSSDSHIFILYSLNGLDFYVAHIEQRTPLTTLNMLLNNVGFTWFVYISQIDGIAEVFKSSIDTMNIPSLASATYN